MTTVGIDVGGTGVKGALVSHDGAVLAGATEQTPRSAAQLTRVVVDLVDTLRDDRTTGVGVVSPGTVADGVVRFAANLPWRDEPVADRLAAASGLATVLGRDVAAAALAESAALDEADVLFVALGTGIAAAHVRAGIAHPGATGQAGELGHHPVHPDGVACPCGQRGCLEQYASATAVAGRYAARTGVELDAAEIARRVAHDPDAATVWREAVDALALALVTCTLLLDPGVIVVGGGLGQAGHALLDPLRAQLAARLAWRSAPPVRAALLGPSAGQLGAARLAAQLTGAPR